MVPLTHTFCSVVRTRGRSGSVDLMLMKSYLVSNTRDRKLKDIHTHTSTQKKPHSEVYPEAHWPDHNNGGKLMAMSEDLGFTTPFVLPLEAPFQIKKNRNRTNGVNEDLTRTTFHRKTHAHSNNNSAQRKKPTGLLICCNLIMNF